MSCGAELEANALINSLTAGENFDFPDVDTDSELFQIPGTVDGTLYKEVTPLTNDDLTTREVNGQGTFDALMAGFAAHLKAEYDRGRITGAEYTKAYVTLTEGAMSNSVQFLLNRDQTYWAAQAAQIAAITARLQLEIAKAQLSVVQAEAMNQKATYALTKMKLASESAAYCVAQYQLNNILPANLKMIQEQAEAQRGQTSDTRSDGTSVRGVMGKQKELYSQQVTSYQRDAEVKAAKLFTDAWITQKTLDEGLPPPSNFANPSLDTVLAKLKSNNGLT